MASSEEDVRNKQIRKLISLRNRVSQRRPFRSQVDGTQEFRRRAVIGFEIPVTRARVWNKLGKHRWHRYQQWSQKAGHSIFTDFQMWQVLRQCSRCICRSRALAEASQEKPQVYPMQASSHWLTWSTLVSATVSSRNYTKDYIKSLTACAHVGPPEWSSRWDTAVFTFLRLFSASWLAGLHYILQKNIWEESAVATNFVSPKPELVEWLSNFQARRRAVERFGVSCFAAHFGLNSGTECTRNTQPVSGQLSYKVTTPIDLTTNCAYSLGQSTCVLSAFAF